MNEQELQGYLRTEIADENKWNETYTVTDLVEVVNITDIDENVREVNNWWGLVALVLVVCTAAGNVLVCLAIYLERRLQNVTNYFLMSLAITDLLVAILVMPLGILTLVRGRYQKEIIKVFYLVYMLEILYPLLVYYWLYKF